MSKQPIGKNELLLSSKKKNDVSWDTIMKAAIAILIIFILFFVLIVNPVFFGFIIVLSVIGSGIFHIIRDYYASAKINPKPIIPLMDQEPKSVVELWFIGIIVSLILFLLHPILGAVSGSISGIAILVRIDSNNKLIRNQISEQKNS